MRAKVSYRSLWKVLPSAVIGLALLWLAPVRWGGMDSGIIGSVFVGLSAWLALAVVASVPASDQARFSPGEARAWIAFAFSLLLTLELLRMSDHLAAGWWQPGMRHVLAHVGILIAAWIVVAALARRKLRGAVVEDERDRAIDAVGGSVGHVAMVLCLIGFAVMLGLSPPQRLTWVTPPVVATQMLFILLWSGIVDYATRGVLYWRDRR